MCFKCESIVRADEGRAAAEREAERVERAVDRAHGVDFVFRPDRRGRRVLALGEPVDLVVEEQDLQVDVAAQDVRHVVAADREPVAVAGDRSTR
jgi:hypothetical protein